MHDLPTDSEYCDQLYAKYKDETWAQFWEAYLPQLIGGLPADREIPEGAVEELNSAKATYRGRLASELRSFALQTLDDSCVAAKNTPVAFLPMRDLNGCAIQTPRNGAVILLNSGGIFVIKSLAICYQILSEYTGLPKFRDDNWAQLVKTLRHLADFTVTGDYAHLVKGTPAVEGSLETPERVIQFLVAAFILLHEYGHVELGHLKGAPVDTLMIGSESEKRYSLSQRQEFEADEFAYSHLANRFPKTAALAPGVFFNFFHLCECIAYSESSSHPPALERWEAIKSLPRFDSSKDTFAPDIDETFAEIQESFVKGTEPAGGA